MTTDTWRIKVACINWSHALAPHAMSYAWNGENMVGTAYHATWGKAMDRANHLAGVYAKIGGPHVFKRVS